MAPILLFLLTWFVAHASCQNSLTFVIDDTNSMLDDIKQVKYAAKSIVDIVLNKETSQIEDIVLVTFNDPETMLRKKTRDAEELKKALDSIVVKDGGDCAEAALAGISLGLQESRPRSDLYVFTDASAKDYAKFDDVRALAEAKQTPLVFVVTGHCDDLREESYQVYHKLATASAGQVFHVAKNDVGNVLNYVKETARGNRTVLVSELIPAHEWKDIKFTIDELTEYAIVSSSGGSVALKVLDRNHQYMSRYRTERITWTQNVKVLKLANLPPGTYTARVRGSSEVNIMVFGRTDFTFRHGFSPEPGTSLEGAHAQPVAGAPTHLLVAVQDKTHSATVREVELRDMNDVVVMTLPLTRVAGDVYRTDQFLPPQQTFKIVVVATSNNSQATVRRVAKTPVSPIQLARPVIDKTEKLVKVNEGASVDLHCRLVGKPKPQISWLMKKEQEAEFRPLQEVGGVLSVTGARDNDYYKCVARNAAGRDEHVLQLDVQAKPIIDKQETDQSVMENGTIALHCRATRGSTVAWYHKGTHSNEYELVSKNETLHLSNANPSLAGQYKCVAQNELGTDEHVVTLVVNVRPVLYKAEKLVKVSEGASVDLHCRIQQGVPAPRITWYVKGQGEADFTLLGNTNNVITATAAATVGDVITVSNDNVITVSNARTNDYYKCVATNVVGQDEHILQLDVRARPIIDKQVTDQSVMENGTIDLHCRATTGSTVAWYHKGTHSNEYELVSKNETLHLSNASPSLTGRYKCVAQNEFGTDEHVVTLVVNVRPVIYNKSEKLIKVNEGASVDLHCRIQQSVPAPQITWYVKRQGEADYTLLGNTDNVISATVAGVITVTNNNVITATNDGVITVNNALTNDYYKCVAKNVAGFDEHVLQLDVQVPPQFLNAEHTVLKVNEGEPVTLDCKILKGRPRPEITWEFKSRVSTSYKTLSQDGEELVIASAQLSHSGHYVCMAGNDAGYNAKSTELVVYGPPSVPRIVFEPPQSAEVSGVAGDAALRLPCVAEGRPAPAVSWAVDGLLVGTDKSKGMYVEGSALVLLRPQETHSTSNGHTYVCRATNYYGQTVQPYTVDITEYVDVGQPSEPQYGVPGKSLDVVCPLPSDDPSSVRWFKYSEDLKKTGPTLHLQDGSDAANGNYTCRVSDLSGAASATIEVIFV